MHNIEITQPATHQTVQRTFPNTQRKTQRNMQKLHDRILIESTQRCQAEPLIDNNGNLYAFNQFLDYTKLDFKNKDLKHKPDKTRTLFKPQKCYICKTHFFEVHHFYHRLCPCCAKVNEDYRTQTADLTGRVALVTGGRIKIGFEIALKLLRAGATVLITTRFLQDAMQRYQQQADFADWQHRLTIYALDLKHINSVEAFTDYLNQTYDALDILINNAAQTLRKPDSFYQHMARQEQQLASQNTKQLHLLGGYTDALLMQDNQYHLQTVQHKTAKNELRDSAFMPTDEFNEPIDFAKTNCWTKRLHDIDTLTFLEAQIINATAPFLLNARLKPLMLNSSFEQRFIINVSAMEGQFNRKNKTCNHAHTNMAKASLNMMTRTAGVDYARDNIYMNSVDTGWVTQENPFHIRQTSRIKGMVPPLDCIDGASRVLAPIFDTLLGDMLDTDDTPVFGKFLKDYAVCEW